jgi:hypothetical protein
MKTVKTETKNKILPFIHGIVIHWSKFFNFKNGKVVVCVLLTLLLLQLDLKATTKKDLWQFSLASGIHTFYAPVENLKWDNPGFMVSGGINLLLGQKQLFSAGLHIGYGQNNYQGDAASVQLLGQFLPVILKKIELGIGTGAGYRFSGYPSTPLKWNGSSWDYAKNYKGIIQIPFQLSIGYRTLNITSIKVIPFAAYHLQAMFGYNPDFAPLPDSSLMFGFKFNL